MGVKLVAKGEIVGFFMKKQFDLCGGDCSVCPRRQLINLSGGVVLVKRKVTKKYVPPDMSALKLLMEKDARSKALEQMTDDELLAFEQSILEQLRQE